MDNKEAIIQATIALIDEHGEDPAVVTVRDICRRAGVGLGLVNYYFGSKEQLIELCVGRIINSVVARFVIMREQTRSLPPLTALERLGLMTFTFLIEHEAMCRISVLSDLRAPMPGDNTDRTRQAFLPLISACRPNWSAEKVGRKAFLLISSLQLAFVRREVLLTEGVDLRDPDQRRAFHSRMLREVMEMGR